MAKPILLFKDFLCFVKNHNGKPVRIQTTEDFTSPIKSAPAEKYEIKIGNNFINQEGSLSHFGNDFNLILRIYGPDLIYYDDPSLIPVAKILKRSCK